MFIRRTVGFLIIALTILALASIASANSLPLVHNPEIPADRVIEDQIYGRIDVKYDKAGQFDFFDFYITATKAQSGTRYRTPVMWIDIKDHPRLYFDASSLSNWQPVGASAGQAVRVKISDILNSIIRVNPSVNDEREAAAVLFSNDHISIGFKIETYNAATGATISGPVEEKAAAISMLQASGFGSEHIQDVEKMFQSLPLLIPRVTASYYEAKEHFGSYGIEYQAQKYEWVKNITYDFIQPPSFGDETTVKNIPDGKDHLFTGYQYLCSGISYPPDTAALEITGETSRKVTATREQPGVNVRFYFIKQVLPDFAVFELDPGANQSERGVLYTGKVAFMLKPDHKEPVEAEIILTHNGYALSTPDSEPIDGQRLIFKPGESKSFDFNWTGQAADSLFRAEIWPTEPSDQPKESRDAYPEDNVLEIKVPRAGYKLTMQRIGQGTTTPPEGVHIYSANERVELSAIPAPGWKFVRWEGDVPGTNPDTYIVMNSDKKVRAVFERVTHTLTIRANPNIGGTTNPAPGVYKYKHGETVNIKATANQDWKFVRWTGNASGTNPSTNVLMDRDKVVIAQFEQDFPAPMDPGDPKGIGEPILQPKP